MVNTVYDVFYLKRITIYTSPMSVFGNIVVLAHAFDQLFSKRNCPTCKASYGISVSTVGAQHSTKQAIVSRFDRGVCIKRNAWDCSSIRHATLFVYLRLFRTF